MIGYEVSSPKTLDFQTLETPGLLLLYFVLGPHLAVLRDHSWCLGGLYGDTEDLTRSAVCRANALPTVQSLCNHSCSSNPRTLRKHKDIDLTCALAC